MQLGKKIKIKQPMTGTAKDIPKLFQILGESYCPN